MAEFVLEELGCFDEVADVVAFVLGEVYLDFSATSAAAFVVEHVLVELGDGVVVGPGPNVEHEGVLGLQVLADALEEPLVTVDLPVVLLLQSEDEVNATTGQRLIFKAEVPGADLEEMQTVLGDGLHSFVHEFDHGLHLPGAIPLLLHEALDFEDVLIEEGVLLGELLERFCDLVEAIAYQHYHEILLPHLDLGVEVHGIVVLEHSADRSLQLGFVFIVHRDTDR
mmetsp:Transcript_9471/g.14522  ORF Transcript_9471/g.14522 Transcript_9471/m.14522 type:complete len:225 (-) Transcript_9471:210-884(-)